MFIRNVLISESKYGNIIPIQMETDKCPDYQSVIRPHKVNYMFLVLPTPQD